MTMIVFHPHAAALTPSSTHSKTLPIVLRFLMAFLIEKCNFVE